MKLYRDNIFKKYKWLIEKKRPFIISSNYDGIICASFLSHYLDWELVGYYDYNNIWLSDNAVKNKKDIIWVDLNILPKTGKSIGGHIISIKDETPIGFKTSCNANILAKVTSKNFNKKYPFSTLLLLLWLYNIKYKKDDIGKLFLLHSDNTWMKVQKYSNNISSWKDILADYNWDQLFNNIDSIEYESKIDQYLYPKLIQIGAFSKFGKLSSKYLNIKSRECKFNPDWDTDIILKLFDFFGNYLDWTPPTLPLISECISGKRYKISLEHVKKIGLNEFIKKNKIFSYAITSQTHINYTLFNSYHSNAKKS